MNCRKNLTTGSGSAPRWPRQRSAICTQMKDRLPVARLIQEAMARTGYDAVLLAEFLGERKLANLQKLVEQARSFDRAGIFTLADFIARAFRVCRPAARRGVGRHAPGTERRRQVDVDPSVEGAGVSGGDRAGRRPSAPRRRAADRFFAATRAGAERREGDDRLRSADGRGKRRGAKGDQPAALRRHNPGRRLSDPLGRR